VKLKTLAVITLVVLGCRLASAQVGTFYFWEAGTDILYCNYLVITHNSGGVVAGYDNLTTYCNLPVNAAVVGFDATVPNEGQPAHGKGIVVGDAIYDASCDCYSGLQWTLWISNKYSKTRHGALYGPYGWIGVAGSYSGFYFGDNYGWTTATPVPSKSKVAAHRTTAGTLPEKLRK
jgi:hypothetical protein